MANPASLLRPRWWAVQIGYLRGPTYECNGAPLCRRHHRAKQAPGWHLSQDQPGVMTWHLPSRREYQTTGEPYLE